MSRKPRILVAMSGGVDSSVVAALLVRRGYEVVGATMQIWQESQTDPRHSGCCSLGAVEDARRVAALLGIPYYVFNMKEEFREAVIADFLEEYAAGRTPNPCIQCNRVVKFDLLLNKANEAGCELLATGHYARTRRGGASWRLLRARDKAKDQSYALYSLTQAQLSRVRFPLGELYGKSETRAIARELGLPVADKPDSQDVCFVSEAGGYREFLRKHRPDTLRAGEIVDRDGRAIGTHGGVALYTIGQRKGVAANPEGKPLYVTRLDPRTNRVFVGCDEDLLCKRVVFEDVVNALAKKTRVDGKIRYNMACARATFIPGFPACAVFDEPVRAVTPGQAAVFYRGERVVAGGTIVAGSAE